MFTITCKPPKALLYRVFRRFEQQMFKTSTCRNQIALGGGRIESRGMNQECVIVNSNNFKWELVLLDLLNKII